MVRLSAVGRVVRIDARDDDLYLAVECPFYDPVARSRSYVTVVAAVKSNSFTQNLTGRSVYFEGSDLRVVASTDRSSFQVVLLNARIESA